MAILRDRNKQVPGGLRFRQPETSWDSTKQLYMMPSLRVLSQAVLTHRKANPYLAKTHGWHMDIDSIENEVDAYNAQICVDNGWLDYVMQTPAASYASFQAPPPRVVSQLVAGAKTIKDMLGPEGAVEHGEANRRALICAACPSNTKGDWTRFFTKPASELIRGMMNGIRDMGLHTDSDDKLHVCEICKCPLKLKIHARLEHIRAHMDNETLAALPQSYCWIVKSP